MKTSLFKIIAILYLFSSLSLFAAEKVEEGNKDIADVKIMFAENAINYKTITRDGREVLRLLPSPKTKVRWVRLANKLSEILNIPVEIDIVKDPKTGAEIEGAFSSSGAVRRLYLHPIMATSFDGNIESLIIHESIHAGINNLAVSTKDSLWVTEIYPDEKLLPKDFPAGYKQFFRIDEILAFTRSNSRMRHAIRRLGPKLNKFKKLIMEKIEQRHYIAKKFLEAAIAHLEEALSDTESIDWFNPLVTRFVPSNNKKGLVRLRVITKKGLVFRVGIVLDTFVNEDGIRTFRKGEVISQLQRTLAMLKEIKIARITNNCREVFAKYSSSGNLKK